VVVNFDSTVNHFDIPPYGSLDYHQWNHPCEAKKHFDKLMVDYYARFVKYGPYAIDVGAHTGDTTLPIALAGFKATIALEPNPHVFEILRRNAAENLHLNILPVCAAAMEIPGSYEFHYGSEFCNGGYKDTDDDFRFPGGRPIQVVGINLLEFLETQMVAIEDVGFIKVDTEGHDRHVLETLMPVKDRLRAAIQVEIFINLNEAGIKKLEETIDKLGYKMYTVDLVPVESCAKSGLWPCAKWSNDLILLRN